MTLKQPRETTDKVRCNNCMGVFDDEITECPKCKTEAYLMQPFTEKPSNPAPCPQKRSHKNKDGCIVCGWKKPPTPIGGYSSPAWNQAHTPTPWKVGMYGASADFRAIDIHTAVCKPDGSLLATCGPWDDESKADAAFIVKCVNAHESLLRQVNTRRIELCAIAARTKGIEQEAAYESLKSCEEAIERAEG